MIKTVPSSNSLGVLQLFIKEGGSRYLKQGVPAMLGYFGYSGNENYTQLRIAREAEQRGVAFSYTVERDYLAFKAQFLKSELPFVLEIFKNIQNAEYAEWKYKDIKAKSERETWGAFSTKSSFLEEYLHLLSYRGQSLGDSVYPQAPPSLSDIQSASTVLKNAQLLGVGFEKSELEQFKGTLGKSKAPEKVAFVGGESAIHKSFSNTVAVSVPIANAADANALKRALGDTLPKLKYGNPQSLIGLVAPKGVKITTRACHHENAPSLLQFTVSATSNDQFKASYAAIHSAVSKTKETLATLPSDTLNGHLRDLVNEQLGIKVENGNAQQGAQEAAKNLKSLKSVVYVGDVNYIPRFQ